MAYNYETQKAAIFTEKGVDALLKIRDEVNEKLKISGAFIAWVVGCTWLDFAVLDYLLERKEIQEVTGSDTFGQERVFIKGEAWGKEKASEIESESD